MFLRREENLRKFECMFLLSSYQSCHFLCFSRFETCWPALMKDSHGVIIIFNPELPSHLKEIEMWYSCFVQQQPLLDGQCLLVAHHKPGSAGTRKTCPWVRRWKTPFAAQSFSLIFVSLKLFMPLWLAFFI